MWCGVAAFVLPGMWTLCLQGWCDYWRSFDLDLRISVSYWGLAVLLVVVVLIITFKGKHSARTLNRRQLIAMWCGIAAIVLPAILEDSARLMSVAFRQGGKIFGDRIIADYAQYGFVVLLITIGLVITFKDKKVKDEQKQ